ncbi:MAG: methyltransferase domain-containing protein [Solidesulfovibrio sp. DCME]|uniref:methyltransferase domain-containing protein n=1 Tax=Solidesulfovibrio sp. DCME TaxID=3447380 RepID=UPI003D10DA8F
MPFSATAWTRIASDDTAIYLRPDAPDWFVPNAAGDAVIQAARAGQQPDCAARLFLGRLPDTPPLPYDGRQAALPAGRLKELWLHVTDRCNLACRHCLFCSGPAAGRELPTDLALARLGEARALGCRVFALTGGEPFLHPGFTAIIEEALADPAAHVVVLTNGTGFGAMADRLGRWPRERLHFQVSCDGLAARHDALRGEGAFVRLMADLQAARRLGFPLTVSFCPTRDNLADLPGVVAAAAAAGAAGLHLMWHFAVGRGRDDDRPDLEALYAAVVAAWDWAEGLGLAVDNIEALRAQVFAPVGTRHDGTTAGYESVALGPDDRLYPSPALIGVEELATPIPAGGGLAAAWRDSPVLGRLRAASCRENPSPWKYLLGGGDPDHSYRQAGTFTGDDPYQPLLERLAARLIAREARAVAAPAHNGRPALRLKMGETHVSCHAHGEVALAHTNCLLSLAGEGSLGQIKAFYTEAAAVEKGDIVNPVHYPPEMVEHIPPHFRVRGYGCGSPIADAAPRPGETLVDLGCGAGVECLIAARQVGPAGRVIGLDMLPAMLARASAAAAATARSLGYANTAFFQGYLEAMPLATATADCVTSNCVLNLSTRKRQLYAEILRILKPGGRLVFSDVATETPASASICNDPTLRGECISGTLTQSDLVAILEEAGFVGVHILRRFPYRVVRDHPFYSVTVEARRPRPTPQRRKVFYRGPHPAVVTASGALLRAGEVREIELWEEDLAGEALFVLDEAGAIANPGFQVGEGCCCGAPAKPDAALTALLDKQPKPGELTPLNLAPPTAEKPAP